MPSEMEKNEVGKKNPAFNALTHIFKMILMEKDIFFVNRISILACDIKKWKNSNTAIDGYSDMLGDSAHAQCCSVYNIIFFFHVHKF